MGNLANNKTGKLSNKMALGIIAMIVVAILATALVTSYILGNKAAPQEQSSTGSPSTGGTNVAGTTPTGDVSDAAIIAASLCQGDLSPPVRFETKNSLDRIGVRYASSKIWLEPIKSTVPGIKSSRFSVNTIGGATETAVTETTNTGCGVEYEAIVETNTSNTNGAYFTSFDGQPINAVGGSPLYDFKVSNFSNLKCRVKDVDRNGDFVWNAADSRDGVTSANGYVALSATNYVQSTTNATNKTIGADDSTSFRYEIECLAINPYSQFGITTGVAVDTQDDSNVADWDETGMVFKVNGVGGQELSNIKANLDTKDQEGLQKFERVYNLGKAINGIDPTFAYIKLPSSSTNPDYTVQLKYLGSSIKKSTLADGQYLGKTQSVPRYYDDAVSPAEIATGTDNSLFIPST